MRVYIYMRKYKIYIYVYIYIYIYTYMYISVLINPFTVQLGAIFQRETKGWTSNSHEVIP